MVCNGQVCDPAACALGDKVSLPTIGVVGLLELQGSGWLPYCWQGTSPPSCTCLCSLGLVCWNQPAATATCLTEQACP